MDRLIQTKFFEFNQTNSGGCFDVDENVCHRVVIEAIDSNHAKSIFEPMIINQSHSCPCCGDRWSSYDPDEIDISKYKEKGYEAGIYSHYPNAEELWHKKFGYLRRVKDPVWEKKYGSRKFTGYVFFETIEQYCQFMADEYGWTIPDVRIHYLDGTKKEIFKQELI